MKHFSECLFAMMVFLLMGFSTTSCPAQDEGQLLHAGLLGYTGGIEASYSSVGEIRGYWNEDDYDISNFAILLNVGFRF